MVEIKRDGARARERETATWARVRERERERDVQHFNIQEHLFGTRDGILDHRTNPPHLRRVAWCHKPKASSQISMWYPNASALEVKNSLMLNMFNFLGGGESHPQLPYVQEQPSIGHVEHFPCFKHILIEHGPKRLNIERFPSFKHSCPFQARTLKKSSVLSIFCRI